MATYTHLGAFAVHEIRGLQNGMGRIEADEAGDKFNYGLFLRFGNFNNNCCGYEGARLVKSEEQLQGLLDEYQEAGLIDAQEAYFAFEHLHDYV